MPRSSSPPGKMSGYSITPDFCNNNFCNKMSTGRAWCFTLNFDGERPELTFPDSVVYAVWQHERVGHDHLQGYVEMANNSRLSAMKKIIPSAHWEPRRGTQAQAVGRLRQEGRVPRRRALGARHACARCRHTARVRAATSTMLKRCSPPPGASRMSPCSVHIKACK